MIRRVKRCVVAIVVYAMSKGNTLDSILSGGMGAGGSGTKTVVNIALEGVIDRSVCALCSLDRVPGSLIPFMQP